MNTLSEHPGQLAAQNAPGPASPAKRILRFLIIAAIALGGAAIFAARVNPARMDYLSYWASAKLLVHHANPYSPQAVLALEKPLGYLPSQPLIMRNPPWALFLVAPLGIFGARAGLVLWILAIGVCIVVSVNLLNPRSQDNALALFFAPAIACIGSGQSSAFLLLGFALFLYFHRRRPFFAGAALLFLAFKPHLFLVFWVVLLAESIYQRNFRFLAGLASALALATALAMAVDPRVWTHYFAMLGQATLGHKLFPTASMMFRILIDPNAFWLLFVPSGLAILWSLWYYARHRQHWDWRTQGMLLMLVAIAVSPYGFITDEIVLLPSIIFALNLAGRRPNAGWVLLAINALAVLVYTFASSPLTTPVLVWTPITWLAWFLYATYHPKLPVKTSITALANQNAS